MIRSAYQISSIVTVSSSMRSLSYHTQEERDSGVEDPLIQIKEVDSDVSKDDSDIGDLEDTCMGIERYSYHLFFFYELIDV